MSARDWQVRRIREARKERRRRERLLRKVQKAKALDSLEEILVLPSWGKRFGRAAKLRVSR